MYDGSTKENYDRNILDVIHSTRGVQSDINRRWVLSKNEVFLAHHSSVYFNWTNYYELLRITSSGPLV